MMVTRKKANNTKNRIEIKLDPAFPCSAFSCKQEGRCFDIPLTYLKRLPLCLSLKWHVIIVFYQWDL